MPTPGSRPTSRPTGCPPTRRCRRTTMRRPARAALGSGYAAIRGVFAWRRSRRRVTLAGHAPPSQIDFYRRLEELLAVHNLRRLAGQTQREFAHLAGGQLAETAATQPAALLPR